MLSAAVLGLLDDMLDRDVSAADIDDTPKPKYGEDIFVDDGPRTFAEYIGQRGAIRQLSASITAAKKLGRRLPHVALASGAAGLGKTSLARIIAAELQVGIFETSGKLTVEDVRPILRGMADGDVLFIDEAHLLMASANAAESWLLSLMEGGILQTAYGREQMPDITVVAATTEFGKLKPAWQSRFMLRPVLKPYDDEEALQIARSHAERLGFGSNATDADGQPLDLPMPTDEVLATVASAANNSPRAVKPILIALRDAYLGEPGPDGFDVDLALEWVGVTRDGLDTMAVEYLLAMQVLSGRASAKSVAGVLGEPGSLQQTEQLLQQRGYLRIEPQGRVLTETGRVRARQLNQERAA